MKFKLSWSAFVIFILSTLLFHICFAQKENVRYVHVISMNHLDIGFDGIDPTIGYAINIINKYFTEYFPNAIKTAQQLRQMGGIERLIYTTHSWLASIYLDCENSGIPQLPEINVRLACPSKTEIDAFINASLQGDITWHAFPFNAEPEIADASLLISGIQLTHDLDVKFNKSLTITLSQRDVPGMTRSIIPVLKKVGVRAISVGVNGASAPPVVPSAFVWRDPVSGEDIIAMWHPGGYGGIDIPDCVIVPGFEHALAFAIRGDNSGPPPVSEVLNNFAHLQKEFPGAQIMASTFDNFVVELEKVKSSLPIFESEIGDTWIHGVQSDPLKVAQFRTILRLRKACLDSGACRSTDAFFKRFDRLLIKVAEHTWGCDVKTFLKDWGNWSNTNFQKARVGQNYAIMENSWKEQRAYITNAINALGNFVLADQIQKALQELVASIPSTNGYTRVQNVNTIFKIGNIELGFDSNSGAISHLKDFKSGINWASSTNLLGLFQYSTYTAQDFLSFLKEYLLCPISACTWAEGDFGKPNVSLGNPEHKTWFPSLVSLWQKNSASGSSFLIQLSMASEAYTKYGSPQSLWIQVDVSSSQPTLNLILYFISKTSTRLPEALFFNFSPNLIQGGQWVMDKLGEEVSPLDINLNGSHHLHGIQEYVRYGNGINSIKITSQDVAIVVPGEPNPFPTPFEVPNVELGMNFLMYNNIWGTNYIMWYPFIQEDSNSLYRFSINLQ